VLFLEVKVFPSSGKHQIKIDKNGIIRCYVKAAPEDGKANKELVRLLADFCSISLHKVEIRGGLTDRKKYLAIDVDLDRDRFLERCNSGVQKKLF
jgi:uncharacterized protein YggU (UPF0235/DUF167 family)